jgi:hypothetical protein
MYRMEYDNSRDAIELKAKNPLMKSLYLRYHEPPSLPSLLSTTTQATATTTSNVTTNMVKTYTSIPLTKDDWIQCMNILIQQANQQ